MQKQSQSQKQKQQSDCYYNFEFNDIKVIFERLSKKYGCPIYPDMLRSIGETFNYLPNSEYLAIYTSSGHIVYTVLDKPYIMNKSEYIKVLYSDIDLNLLDFHKIKKIKKWQSIP